MIVNVPTKRISAMYSNKHFLEFNPQNGGENQLACIDRELNYVIVTLFIECATFSKISL